MQVMKLERELVPPHLGQTKGANEAAGILGHTSQWVQERCGSVWIAITVYMCINV